MTQTGLWMRLTVSAFVLAFGFAYWRVRVGASARWHPGIWRHDIRLVYRDLCHSAALRLFPGYS
jgi:hypothetical protein